MSARTSAAVIAAALLLSSPATSQVASAPLNQIDSWGVGWLGANDGALPATIWSNTTTDALVPLYASLQPKDLAPSARAALRRVVLSKTKGPAGAAALIPERLRLIEQLGETEHAVDLRKRYADTDWGKPGERLGADLELLQGKSQSACSRAAAKRGSDTNWMPVRAFCAAIDGKFDAASLAGEQFAATDEANGVWLLGAIGAMQGPAKTKPDGRYATPLEAAISIAAKLSVPANALAAPSDIAAAVALNPAATLEQKRAALRPALDGGQLKPSEVLAILTVKDETPAAKPANARAAAPRTDYLALALAAFASGDAKPDAKGAAYAAALKGAESLGEFRLSATALSDAIKALPKNAATLPNAETFARAALLMGDEKQAGEWRKLMDAAPKDKADPWAAARIDLMLSYAGAATDKPGVILDRLIAAAPPLPPPPLPGAAPASPAATSKTPPPPVDRQLELRRIENTRALFLHAGTGRDLSPAQRALLAYQRTAGRGVSDAAIARIASAADQDADGEAALAIIALLGPDVSALSFAGLSDLLAQLRRIGMEEDADAIALESLQVWKAL